MSIKFVITWILLSSQVLISQNIIGKVVGITDGDTFKLLEKDSILHKVRVANIACPERGQPFSNRAKQFTSDAIFSKDIKIEVLNTDRYGRLIAFAIYDDGLNLSEELVRSGYAWNYDKYSDDEVLINLEKEARNKKLGLWSEPHPIPPWEWRKGKR
jgi:endonuclease YncB( thermonuclease family)